MNALDATSAIANTVVGLVSITVAYLAFRIAIHQYRDSASMAEEAPAREAVDRLFSEPMAIVRYRLYDMVNEVAAAASGTLSREQNLRFRREFNVGPDSMFLPTRYQLVRRWSRLPPRDPAEQAYRDEFLQLSSVLCANFDAILRAAERGPAAAAIVQQRVGRLIVWWMLVWPGLFDHTNSFLARKYVADSDIRHHSPEHPESSGYTPRWLQGPLWSVEDWQGALDNFRTLQPTMMPADPFKGTDMHLQLSESIYGHAGDPLDYPGTRPDAPYYIDGATAHKLDWDWDLKNVRLGDGTSLTQILEDHGEENLEDRVVQIAFGANRDLVNLAWKFANYASDPSASVSTRVIVLPGYIDNADVVACNIGYWGYVYAAMILHRPPALNRPYLHGTRVPVSVLLLDAPQMAAMHLSEGVPQDADQAQSRQHVSCDVAVTTVNVLGRELKAQLYALPLPFLSLDESRPVAFDRVEAEGARGKYPRLSESEMWTAITDRLRDRIRPLAEDADSMEIVDLIRAGAILRMAGGSGSSDRSQQLYEEIRTGIIDDLRLLDPDGTVAHAAKDAPGLLSYEEAWLPSPLLGPQL